MIRHALAFVIFFTRKLRRALNLPVADLREARTQLGKSVHAMEAPLKTEPPKE